MPFCVHCGSQEPADATYCGSCGKRLLTTPATAPKNNILPHHRSEIGKELTAPAGQQKAEQKSTLPAQTRQVAQVANKAVTRSPGSDLLGTLTGKIVATAIAVVVIATGGIATAIVFHQVTGHARSGGARPTPHPSQPAGIITEFSLPTNESDPYSITSGPDGNLWFTEQKGIGRITLKGQITKFPVPTANGDLNAITAGPDGNLWFTESGRSWIGRITPAGQITEFPLPDSNSSPGAVTAGPDGNLWFTESASSSGNGDIGRITPHGHITEFPAPPGSQISSVCEITSGPDGNLWFTESASSTGAVEIGRTTPAGHITTEFSLPTLGALPTAITWGPNGNLWFTEEIGGKIGRITPRGQFTQFSLSNSNNSTDGITFGPDGNLWFTEYLGDNIGRITPDGQITEFPLLYSNYPTRITTGLDGNLWFTESNDSEIGRITFLSPSSATQNRAKGSNVSASGSKVPAPYVGQWAHHDYGLTINADGTGEDQENFGFACDNGNRACGRTGTLKFAPTSGALLGTYTSISYDPGLSPTPDDLRVGDSFQLTLAPHDRLILRWLGRMSSDGLTISLCGPKTPLEFWDCGA